MKDTEVRKFPSKAGTTVPVPSTCFTSTFSNLGLIRFFLVLDFTGKRDAVVVVALVGFAPPSLFVPNETT